jgi:hypothetical protein
MITQHFPTGEKKRTYAILQCPWECLDLRIQSLNGVFSCQHVISIDLYFTPTPFVLKHVEALRYSWY